MDVRQFQSRLEEMARRVGEVAKTPGFAGAEVTGPVLNEDTVDGGHILRLAFGTEPVGEGWGRGTVGIEVGHVDTFAKVGRTGVHE